MRNIYVGEDYTPDELPKPHDFTAVVESHTLISTRSGGTVFEVTLLVCGSTERHKWYTGFRQKNSANGAQHDMAFLLSWMRKMRTPLPFKLKHRTSASETQVYLLIVPDFVATAKELY